MPALKNVLNGVSVTDMGVIHVESKGTFPSGFVSNSKQDEKYWHWIYSEEVKCVVGCVLLSPSFEIEPYKECLHWSLLDIVYSNMPMYAQANIRSYYLEEMLPCSLDEFCSDFQLRKDTMDRTFMSYNLSDLQRDRVIERQDWKSEIEQIYVGQTYKKLKLE